VGRRFYKMSGSGNDFVFLDGREPGTGALETPGAIQALCARGTGVGADGVVVLEPGQPDADVRIRYYNADGSRAELCGNATLCSTNLAVRLGLAGAGGFTIATDAGVVRARMRDGLPEFDAPRVTDAAPLWSGEALEGDELRLGFATVGNPHLVVRVPDVERADVAGRGRALRSAAALRHGANVNFVSRDGDGGWRMRTFERGVEGETLACGTGSVATALMLSSWGEAGDEVSLQTRSGRTLRVRLRRDGDMWVPSLQGSGELVFSGELVDLAPEGQEASRRSASTAVAGA
jgi:diaminopimelate epimerase